MKKYFYYILGVVAVILLLFIGWNIEPLPEKNVEQTVFTEEQIPTKTNVITKEKTENKEEHYVNELPKETADEEKKMLCALTVDCSDILKDIESLDEAKRDFTGQNGIIFSKDGIEFKEGDSVFDILKRELKNAGVPMEFSLTPIYNSAYIEGINNIYEFDCGNRSGWKYSVNGVYVQMSCSDYKLKKGDKILFTYKRIGY